MKTLVMKALVLAVAVGLLIGLSPTTASAFWGHRQAVTTNYAMPSVPVAVGDCASSRRVAHYFGAGRRQLRAGCHHACCR